MSCYWEDEDGIWNKQLMEARPLACKDCGIGEYKIIKNVKPEKWCDDCYLPKKRCRCMANKWGEW